MEVHGRIQRSSRALSCAWLHLSPTSVPGLQVKRQHMQAEGQHEGHAAGFPGLASLARFSTAAITMLEAPFPSAACCLGSVSAPATGAADGGPLGTLWERADILHAPLGGDRGQWAGGSVSALYQLPMQKIRVEALRGTQSPAQAARTQAC